MDRDSDYGEPRHYMRGLTVSSTNKSVEMANGERLDYGTHIGTRLGSNLGVLINLCSIA